MKKLNLKVSSIFILFLTGIILFYLIYDINKTKDSLAESLLQNPLESAKTNLRSFSNPVQSTLLAISEQAQFGLFDTISSQLMNKYFAPILTNYSQISSIGLANSEGFEFDVFPHDSVIYNRIVSIDKWGMKSYWSSWRNDPKQGACVLIKKWEDTMKDDPRDREWFTGAIDTPEGHIHWTNPYIYNTTSELGITASTSWIDKKDAKRRVIALDLTLSDITKFTQSLNVSTKGKLFILTKDGHFIGLPRGSELKDKDSMNKTTLKAVNSIGMPPVSDAFDYWNSEQHPIQSFNYDSEGKSWWGKLIYFNLSPHNSILIGVVIPESDILSQVNKTKYITIIGFLIVLLLTIFVLYSYSQSKKLNQLLINKNNVIYQQQKIIQIKNKEQIDSITYAKRIQTAMLPQEDDFKKWLPNSFVFYKPKDIVAGDFYWLEEKNEWILLAAADCTGHGVPGAMVSIICMNAINRSVRDYNKVDPSHILNLTQEMVIQEFERSSEKVRDGMDIAFCALKDNQLKFAGANNPLWIIRKDGNTIEEYKGCKQPIGQFEYSTDFITHDIKMNEGDQFYIFSDGFADQFGGAKVKKFKTFHFKKLLLSICHNDMHIQKNIIEQTFIDWKGDIDQLDDVCVIGVKI